MTAASRTPAALLASMLRPRRKWHLCLFLLLSIAGAMAEVVTIGAIFPLLALSLDPAALHRLPTVAAAIGLFAQFTTASPIVAAACLLAVAAVVATIFRLALNLIGQRLVFAIQTELVLDIFDATLARPYQWFSTSHSAVLLSNVDKALSLGGGVIQPLVQSASAIVMGLGIAALLFLFNPLASAVALAAIASVYIVISLVSRRTLRRASSTQSRLFPQRVRILQDSYGGIREVILDQTRPALVDRLRANEAVLGRSLAMSVSVSQMPRLVVEGAMILVVALLAIIFSTRSGGIAAALPLLGAMAIGAQRLLPLIQQAYVGWSALQGASASIADVAEAVLPGPSIPPSSPKPLCRFAKTIRLKRVGFEYDERGRVLDDIDLVIRKGERLGIIGRTGSGKSTLADLLLGLLAPSQGSIEIDDQPLTRADLPAWWRQVAHVPQSIFLTDDSIAANIAFGHTPIDRERAVAAACKAGLGEFVGRLEKGIDTLVGERGARLSGGQRQRIGIARALYKDARLLILDEATNALDDETERQVMDAIARLGREYTVILIAHRLSTLEGCDRVIRLEYGRLAADGHDAGPVALR